MKNSTATAQMPYLQAPQQQTGASTIRRKIGNTVYRVSVHFSNTSKERLEDKVLRLARNDAMSDIKSITDFTKNNLAFSDKCGTMELPQTGRLLDGGSL